MDCNIGDLVIITTGWRFLMCIVVGIHEAPQDRDGEYYTILTMKHRNRFVVHANEILGNLTQDEDSISAWAEMIKKKVPVL